MTAKIIDFPTMLIRDEIEFDRIGENSFTRSSGEGSYLWHATATGRDVIALAPRIHAFVAKFEHLASYRSDNLDDEILLGGNNSVPLASMPGLLLNILHRATAGQSKQSLDPEKGR